MIKRVNKISGTINKFIPEKPEFAIILGSGLGRFVDKLKHKIEIPYKKISGMPTTTVKGHDGKFVFGYISNKPVLVMQGRLHLYEGYTAKEVVLPIYAFKKIGIENLIITNAAGAVNPEFNPGDIMLIHDQINLTGKNPLIGGQIVKHGDMFVDMINAYNKDFLSKAEKVLKERSIEYKKGTYIQFLGPTYETPAEVKMAKSIGADAVGMSTAVEVIAATQLGIKTLGVSTMANIAVNLHSSPVTHKEVLAVMNESSTNIIRLLTGFLSKD